MSDTDTRRGPGYTRTTELPSGVAAFGDAPEPQDLPSSLLPVAPFDMELLPEKLRPWGRDISERMQCPPDYIGISLMTSVAALVGRKVAIRPMANDDWTEVPNMWAMLVGRPGVLKSPAMDAAMSGLKYLAVQASEKFRVESEKYKLGADARKVMQEALKEAAKRAFKKDKKADVAGMMAMDDEPPPVMRRYIANDTTVEALGEILEQNPNGLLVFRDEMLSLLDNLDQEQNSSQKGFFLSGWNGKESYTFDRIGRGLNKTIHGVCMSLLGSTQPGRIADYLRRATHGGSLDDGMVQRFNMVWPDIPESWSPIDRVPDPVARRLAYEVFEYLDTLDWRGVNAKRDRDHKTGEETGLPYLRFSIDGYDRFMEWRTALERRLRSGNLHPALESHLSKYRKLVPGIALLSHLVDGGTGPVSVEAVMRAIAWAKYLETHAARAYGSVTAVAGDTARAILRRIWDGDLRPGFVARDIYRREWSRLTNPADVHAALDLLVDCQWLLVKKSETGGRPKLTYTLSSHPKAAKPRENAAAA